MDSPKRYREELVQELTGIFLSSLAFRSTKELEMILETMAQASSVFLEREHGIRSANDAAVLLLNNTSSKEEVFEAIASIQDQLEEHWEHLKSRIHVDMATLEEEPDIPDKLLN